MSLVGVDTTELTASVTVNRSPWARGAIDSNECEVLSSFLASNNPSPGTKANNPKKAAEIFLYMEEVYLDTSILAVDGR
jgi:hypothetical protein